MTTLWCVGFAKMFINTLLFADVTMLSLPDVPDWSNLVEIGTDFKSFMHKLEVSPEHNCGKMTHMLHNGNCHRSEMNSYKQIDCCHGATLISPFSLFSSFLGCDLPDYDEDIIKVSIGPRSLQHAFSVEENSSCATVNGQTKSCVVLSDLRTVGARVNESLKPLEWFVLR